MTVVQYCMDLAQHFQELRRVLRQEGVAVYVIGRESKVRGVAFNNGQLLLELAVGGAGFHLQRWQERKFTNRFGAIIYEDLLTLTLGAHNMRSPEEFGRQTGVFALKDALQSAPEDVRADIEQAIERGGELQPSPLLHSTGEAR